MTDSENDYDAEDWRWDNDSMEWRRIRGVSTGMKQIRRQRRDEWRLRMSNKAYTDERSARLARHDRYEHQHTRGERGESRGGDAAQWQENNEGEQENDRDVMRIYNLVGLRTAHYVPPTPPRPRPQMSPNPSPNRVNSNSLICSHCNRGENETGYYLNNSSTETREGRENSINIPRNYNQRNTPQVQETREEGSYRSHYDVGNRNYDQGRREENNYEPYAHNEMRMDDAYNRHNDTEDREMSLNRRLVQEQGIDNHYEDRTFYTHRQVENHDTNRNDARREEGRPSSQTDMRYDRGTNYGHHENYSYPNNSSRNHTSRYMPGSNEDRRPAVGDLHNRRYPRQVPAEDNYDQVRQNTSERREEGRYPLRNQHTRASDLERTNDDYSRQFPRILPSTRRRGRSRGALNNQAYLHNNDNHITGPDNMVREVYRGPSSTVSVPPDRSNQRREVEPTIALSGNTDYLTEARNIRIEVSSTDPEDKQIWYKYKSGQVTFTERIEKRKANVTTKKKAKKRTKWNQSAKYPEGRPVRRKPAESKTALTGHSFITKLKDVLNDKACETGQSWTRTLGIQGRRITPVIKGFGGAHLENWLEIEKFLTKELPDVVILELGSNDLCYGRPIGPLVQRFISRMRDLLNRNRGLQALIWCQVIPRHTLRHGHRDVDKYNQDVIEFNQAMRDEIKSITRLHHWHHKGLSKATKQVMDDGIHPTTAVKGRKKYLGSISSLCKWTMLNQAAESSSSSEDDEEEGED